MKVFKKKPPEDDSIHKVVRINPVEEGFKEAVAVGVGSAVGIVAVFAGLYAITHRFEAAMDLTSMFRAVKDANAVIRESASDSIVTSLPVWAVHWKTMVAVWLIGVVSAFKDGYSRAKEMMERVKKVQA